MMIKVLPPEEARKIAAGEVIDRPAALVREFLDNAIDAGSSQIEVLIENGGIGLVEVSDDGMGMDRQDMSICWLTHATSKIRSLDDLGTISSLGFRGEALSAAAAVSALEILSSKDGRDAWRLRVGPGEKGRPILEQNRRTKGTSIRAMGLYDSIPARKRFLKRPGSEAAACLQIFKEKAMAFPEIAFRFSQDGKLKIFLPPVSTLKDRFCQIHLDTSEGIFLHEIAASGTGFSVSIVAGGPELSRSDRRLQFVFANKRRIQDFALLQALEYGLEGWFPGGTHPLGAVFVNIDPAMADFNIHPAKREARFTDPGAIHHTITSALRDFCQRRNKTASFRGDSYRDDSYKNGTFSNISFRDTSFMAAAGSQEKSASGSLAMEALLSNPPDFKPLPGRAASYTAENSSAYGETHYLGRLFNLFILVEKGDRFFIIDQHAAHEGILYERFIKGSVPKQELLVEIPFTTESPEDDLFLEGKKEELAKLGVYLRRDENEWRIEALPSGWKLSDRETVKEILNLKTASGNIFENWMDSLCCWGAVKDGDFLDRDSALALAEEAFALQSERCPHGRPIWLEISRDDLLKAVKRK